MSQRGYCYGELVRGSEESPETGSKIVCLKKRKKKKKDVTCL